MKIRWLNDSLTRAVVLRRAWPRFWITEFADVRLDPLTSFWFYAVNGLLVEGGYRGLQGRLIGGTSIERDRRRAAEIASYRASLPSPWVRASSKNRIGDA